MYVELGFISAVCRLGKRAIGRHKGGAHTLGALDISLDSGRARGPGLDRNVQLVDGVFHALFNIGHFFGEVRLHLGDGVSESVLALLDFGKLFI